MAAVTTPNLGLKAGYQLNETGWGPGVNLDLRTLDALVQARMIDKDLVAPPGGPAQGDAYIVGPAATGAWATHSGSIAIWQVGDDLASAWAFITPHDGWRVYMTDEALFYTRLAGAWVADLPASRFNAAFGDGASITFNVLHSLGTKDVHVTVYRNAAPWDTIICDVARPDSTHVTLSGFVVAPSVNGYKVVVST